MAHSFGGSNLNLGSVPLTAEATILKISIKGES
jgi:hypothetical protein